LGLKDQLKDHVSYLEILVSSFLEHEKNLYHLLMSLEENIEKISEVTEKLLKETKTGRNRKDLVFIKIKADISREEQRKIREVLNR